MSASARASTRSARQYPWTREEDALLGKLTDREIAEKLNRSLGSVRDRRKFLGITAVGGAPQSFRMPQEPRDGYAKLFAAKSDAELRALLGWSYKRIHTRRRQLAAGKVKKKGPPWTLDEDRLLGTKSDRKIARLIGRSITSVRNRRQVKRIRMTKTWSAEDDKILGTRTDREVALLLGRSVTNVGWRRKRLGIPPKAPPRPWTAEEDALLGTRPDKELAKVFGRTFKAVEARRIQLGRPKPDPVTKVVKLVQPGTGRVLQVGGTFNVKRGASYCTWTPEEDALIGTMPDQELAKKLGYSVERVRRRRQKLGRRSSNPEFRYWTPEEIALLGTAPDREVAKLVNRSIGNVRYKRIELGIPFCNPRYELWPPEHVAMLGKFSDEDVARRTGHSLLSVRHARHKRHIPLKVVG